MSDKPHSTSKQFKNAASESEERYRLIVESTLDYAIFTADPDGIITAWPPGAEAVFGWRAEEIVGKPAHVLFTPEDVASGEPDKEIALAKQTGVAPDVRWHMRKDGSRVFIEGWTRAIHDSTGTVTGLFKIGQNTTSKRELESSLRESEERFRTLVVSIPQMVFRTHGNGDRTWGSPQWEVYSGLTLDASVGTGWLNAVHPDDRDATMKAWHEAQVTGQYYAEHRIRKAADGQYRWHQTRAVRLPGSAQAEWVGTSADVHELHQLHEQQSLLVAELQHRTRNLLAVIQSIMQQTLSTSDTLDDFAQKFGDRLYALSRVQGLLSDGHQEGITVGTVVRLELEALGARPSGRITIDGPHVSLPRNTIQTLALAIHELATNARKYGALKSNGGQLHVTWRIRSDGPHQRVILEWLENGVNVKPENFSRIGFGRSLIEHALPASLNARTDYRMSNDSVHCTIELAL
jgi:PAS domain S-box-containing protein